MHLVQLLLPLYRNDGARQPDGLFDAVRKALVDRFGGLTAYSRAPAEGVWAEGDGAAACRDDIIVYEVMVDGLERDWWKGYREDLAARFGQEELVVRAQAVELL